MKFFVQDIGLVTDGIVLHGCNRQGVMGAGAALTIKQTWPLAYSFYERGYRDYKLGEVIWTPWIGEVKIGNCLTQERYGNNGIFASIEAVTSCVKEGCQVARRTGKSIYMPPIGCGYGGLEWAKVYEAIKGYEKTYGISIIVLSTNRHWVRYARQLNG